MKRTLKAASDSPVREVPFNRPPVVASTATCVLEALQSSHHSGDGPFTRRCHDLLSRHLDGARVLLTTSCTHALEMAALLLDINDGDEVIVPSYTFVSTANAFALRGARIVFADIRPDTLNIDEQALEGLITPRTRAIVPVHYAGVGCEMDAIMALAGDHGIAVVEDNAHGLFGRYRGRPLGTFGAFATQSFHESKVISCGEGGALVINDASLLARAEIVREKGTDRSRFFRGEIDRYTWVDFGSSYLPSDLLAAVLVSQLEAADELQSARRALWQRYDAELAAWADALDVRRPFVPAHCEQAWYIYYLIMPDLATRSRFIQRMKARGVAALFHYLPLHLSRFGSRYGAGAGSCPVTEDLSDRLVRLPLFSGMTPEEQELVIAACLDSL